MQFSLPPFFINKEVKLSLLTENMIVYIKYPTESEKIKN